MKKKLSVLLIVMMAFVAIFALTACDPEIIEKLPEQVLAEMFAQLGDNYVVDVDVSIGEDDEVLQKAKISYEGKKVKYELTLFEPETRYFDIESDGTAYMYVEEPDYGWVKEEIDVGYYNEMVDRFYIERNGLDDASKYTFTVNGNDVKYQLKAEYLPKGVTAVSVWISTDGRLVMTLVDGEGDAAMKQVGYFGSFGKADVTLPEIEEEPDENEMYVNMLGDFFNRLREEMNVRMNISIPGARQSRVEVQSDGKYETYRVIKNTSRAFYLRRTIETNEWFLICFDEELGKNVGYYISEEEALMFFEELGITPLKEMLNHEYYEYIGINENNNTIRYKVKDEFNEAFSEYGVFGDVDFNLKETLDGGDIFYHTTDLPQYGTVQMHVAFNGLSNIRFDLPEYEEAVDHMTMLEEFFEKLSGYNVVMNAIYTYANSSRSARVDVMKVEGSEFYKFNSTTFTINEFYLQRETESGLWYNIVPTQDGTFLRTRIEEETAFSMFALFGIVYADDLLVYEYYTLLEKGFYVYTEEMEREAAQAGFSNIILYINPYDINDAKLSYVATDYTGASAEVEIALNNVGGVNFAIPEYVDAKNAPDIESLFEKANGSNVSFEIRMANDIFLLECMAEGKTYYYRIENLNSDNDISYYVNDTANGTMRAFHVNGDGMLIEEEDVDSSYLEEALQRIYFEQWHSMLDVSFFEYSADENIFYLNEEKAAELEEAGIRRVSLYVISEEGTDKEFVLSFAMDMDTHMETVQVRAFDFGKTSFDLAWEVDVEEKMEELEYFYTRRYNYYGNATIVWTYSGRKYTLMGKTVDGYRYVKYVSEVPGAIIDGQEYKEIIIKTTLYFRVNQDTNEYMQYIHVGDNKYELVDVGRDTLLQLLSQSGYSCCNYVNYASAFTYDAIRSHYVLTYEAAEMAYESFKIRDMRSYLYSADSNPEYVIQFNIEGENIMTAWEWKAFDINKTSFDLPELAA